MIILNLYTIYINVPVFYIVQLNKSAQVTIAALNTTMQIREPQTVLIE